MRLPRGGPLEDDFYGLGIPYLQSYLEQHGHETEAHLDLYMSWKEYLARLDEMIASFQPDYIGVQVYSMNRIHAFKIAELCRNRNIKCVLGGVHSSVFPEQIVEKFPWVQVVVGEGERAMLDIVNGCTDRIVIRDVIEDLDSLPFPKQDFFFNEKPNRRMANMLTSRGCPFKCSFCCLRNVSKGRFRKRSVQNVIDEIVQLKREHPSVERIFFQDDAFTLDSKRVIEMCDRLIELNLGITFLMAGTVKGNTPEMFDKMEKAGLEHLYVGLESGSQALLDRAQKNLKLQEVEQLFANAKGHPRLVISPYLITGLPGETWDTVEETVRFVKRLHRVFYSYVDDSTIIWAYPGTEIYEQMKAAGKITDEYWFEDASCPVWTVEHSIKELNEMKQYLLNRVSFLRIFTPMGFWHQMTNSPINVLRFAWYHPRFLKYALGDSMGYMFPRFYEFVRGYKIQKRYDND
jgi:anaerobic magnesium-protoporphyrin IX monomethyl ester cyclase